MGRGTGRSGSGGHSTLREEERKQLFDDLKSLRRDKLVRFIDKHELEDPGKNKSDFAERILQGLDAAEVKLEDVVAFLDETAEWDKQHVLLLGPPLPSGGDLDPKKWRNPTWLREHLGKHKLAALLGKRKPLVLPLKMELVSILLDAQNQTLRVIAVQRREGFERAPEEDDQTVRDSDGAEVVLRAFVKVVTRGLVVFEWDLRRNEGMVQIRQLPAGLKYEDVFEAFAEKVKAWLPLRRFQHIKLGRAILKLREMAKDQEEGIRAHLVDMVGPDGRRLAGKSEHAQQRLEGNEIIDGAMDDFAEEGAGHSGNFFFEPAANDNAGAADEDDDEEDEGEAAGATRRTRSNDAHVVLQANKKNRINFMTPQPEKVVRDVLRRIRAVC